MTFLDPGWGGDPVPASRCRENSCEWPLSITAIPFGWSGDWDDFGGTFTPSNCGNGSGGDDIWFKVTIPAGRSILVQETGTSNTTVRLVADCDTNSCLDYSENPEELTVPNTTAAERVVYIVISLAGGMDDDVGLAVSFI